MVTADRRVPPCIVSTGDIINKPLISTVKARPGAGQAGSKKITTVSAGLALARDSL